MKFPNACFVLLVVTTMGSTACDSRPAIRSAEASTPDSLAIARRDSIVRSRPGYIIDSILPVEEEIRRFQAAIAKPTTTFSRGATSRQGLVTAFVGAIERNDTTALTQLVIDRAEFGYLVYPTSPNAAPPYRHSPDLVWLSRSASTDKAMTRLLARFGGKPLGYAGFTCADSVDHQGRNAVWSDCVVKRAVGVGDTTRLRMFGAIVARDGRFKFLSLTNGL